MAKETIGDIWNTLTDKQKEAVSMLIEGIIENEEDEENEEEVSENENDDMNETEESVQHSVLRHYGVIGMKWGMRKYQNEDGSLTPEGKARYDSGEMYKSHGTKKLEKRVAKLKKKKEAASKSGKNTARVSKKLKKKMDRLKTSKIMDKAYLDYARKTSYGKAILQNLLFGSFGARGYQQSRAMGLGRLTSAGMANASSTPLSNQLSRYSSRKTYDELRRGALGRYGR